MASASRRDQSLTRKLSLNNTAVLNLSLQPVRRGEISLAVKAETLMDDSPGMRAEDPKVSRVIYADGKTMLTLIELHDPEPPPMHTWWHLLKGILIMKLSVLLLTVSGILVKYHYEFNPLVSVYDLVFVRAFAQLCVALFIAVKDNANLVDLTDHQWKLVFVRSVSGTMTFFIFNAAVKLISLSKVAFLGNTSPIFATIIAFLFLGESLAR